MNVTLNDKQRRALEILRDHPGLRPRDFAGLMWPDSPSWRRHRKHDGASGTGIQFKAGAFLKRLQELGLVTRSTDEYGIGYWYISDAGRRVLERLER